MEFDEARNIIVGIIIDNWNSNYQIEYQNKKLPSLPSGDETWGRLTINHEPFGIRSLADYNGKKRFERTGTLILQIFTPINEGMVLSDSILKPLLNIFEGKTDSTGSIWFRNAYVREIGNTDAHYQNNLIVQFTYTEIK